ncbi:MAG: hypothetical protein WAM14_17510 [Candidatus Nitrosopolaris sp.]
MESFCKDDLHWLYVGLKTAIERKKNEAIKCIKNIIKRIGAKDQ